MHLGVRVYVRVTVVPVATASVKEQDANDVWKTHCVLQIFALIILYN